MTKKKILLFACGGTIASLPGHPYQSHLSPDGLLEYLKPLAQFYNIEAGECFRQDSANVRPEQWSELAGMIRDKAGHYDGIVLTHGTDTLAYTAAMLSWMLKGLPVPLVLTGAQRPLIYPESDGLSNLRCAFAMAASGTGGVFTAFHNQVFPGAHTVKTRGSSFAAFDSPGKPAVGYLNAQGLHIRRERLPRPVDFSFAPGFCEQVFLWKIIPASDPAFADVLIQAGYHGVVLEGYGKGGLPTSPEWQEGLEKLRENHIPVVLCGQCQMEPAQSEEEKAGYWIAGQGMTTEAAVTRLMWVLGQPGVQGIKQAAKLFLDLDGIVS